MTTLLLIAAGVALYALTKNRTKSVGKLSDSELNLKNILMGVDRGWYKARVDKISTGYVVYLSGKKTDGEYTEDVYPISKETYDALVARNIGV